MSQWSSHALELFKARGIDPDVAHASNVREKDGCLVYPTGKRRPLNGNGGAPHLQPEGAPSKPWWVKQGDAGEAVLVTEGETDGMAAATALNKPHMTGADHLHILALPGCTYPPDTLAQGLAHHNIRDAYLCLDADDAGRQALARITRALRSRGIRTIPVELPDGDDLAAWLSDGRDLASLLADSEAAVVQQRKGTSFAEIADEQVEWFWRKRLVKRTLNLVAGDPEQGKSMFTVALAAEASCRGETVIMAAAEDRAPVVRGRLVEAGADLSNVLLADHLILPSNVARLREQVEETNADLITIDPVNAYYADEVHPYKDQSVRAALAPLLKIAADLDVAVVLVCHLNRGGEEESPIYRIPVGLRGIARSILAMKADKDGTHLEHLKCSYGPKQKPIEYRFEGGCLQECDTAPPESAPAVTAASVTREGSALVLDYTGPDMGVSQFDD